MLSFNRGCLTFIPAAILFSKASDTISLTNFIFSKTSLSGLSTSPNDSLDKSFGLNQSQRWTLSGSSSSFRARWILSAINGITGAEILAKFFKTKTVVIMAFLFSTTSSLLNLSLDLLRNQVEKSSIKDLRARQTKILLYFSKPSVIFFAVSLSLEITQTSSMLSDFSIFSVSLFPYISKKLRQFSK